MPHPGLTAEQIAGLRKVGVPLPPADAEQSGIGDFDWRRPADGAAKDETTPTSFCWRIDSNGNVRVFCAYGWRYREIGYGRTAKDPEFGYSILSAPDRDAWAKATFTEY